MTITTREAVVAAVARTLMLGATQDEAIATVAQALHLSPETVAECLQGKELAA